MLKMTIRKAETERPKMLAFIAELKRKKYWVKILSKKRNKLKKWSKTEWMKS